MFNHKFKQVNLALYLFRKLLATCLWRVLGSWIHASSTYRYHITHWRYWATTWLAGVVNITSTHKQVTALMRNLHLHGKSNETLVEDVEVLKWLHPVGFHTPMFRHQYVPTTLCSDTPMFRQPYVPTTLCSDTNVAKMWAQMATKLVKTTSWYWLEDNDSCLLFME